MGAPLALFLRRAFALAIDFVIAGAGFLLVVVGGGIIGVRLGLIALHEDVRFQFTFFRNWYSIVWLVLYFTLTVARSTIE